MPKKLTTKQIDIVKRVIEEKRKSLKKCRYGQVERSLFLMMQIENLNNVLLANQR